MLRSHNTGEFSLLLIIMLSTLLLNSFVIFPPRFEFPIRSRNKRAKKKRDEFEMSVGSSVSLFFSLSFFSNLNIIINSQNTDDVEDEHSHETLHWLRLDPEDEWILSKVHINQNDASWRRQLQLDKDVLSQLQCAQNLPSFFSIFFSFFFLMNDLIPLSPFCSYPRLASEAVKTNSAGTPCNHD